MISARAGLLEGMAIWHSVFEQQTTASLANLALAQHASVSPAEALALQSR